MDPIVRKLIDDFCSMAEGVAPEVVEEFRDKRIDWNLRELLSPNTDSLICQIWALRNPKVDNLKSQCQFCAREIVVERANAAAAPNLICIVCWLRAGAPDYEKLENMAGGEKLSHEEAEALDKGGQGSA